MITVNNRDYAQPTKTIVGICMDGTSQAYYDAAKDVMPNLKRIREKGSSGLVNTVVPSFTNPNNMAIITGVPPETNGICGNYYYDTEADEEVMMNDPKFMIVPTIPSQLAKQGTRVAIVTVKDKLRRLLGKDLKGICFSAEFADKVTIEENGIDDVVKLMGREQPGIYDPEISVYCLEAGVRLLETREIDFMYLTTTDFVQHKWAPGEPEANAFLARIDEMFGRLDDLGATVAITADHGMNDKTKSDGTPDVVFAESVLTNVGISEARVILPITDPYVVHHGALGSFATVYVNNENVALATKTLSTIDGLEVLSGDSAAERFKLPQNRIGELVVLGDKSTVIGRTPEWHDLSVVSSGLRSHGGLHEARVPFIVNRPLNKDIQSALTKGSMNNYDLFSVLCNGVSE